MDLSVAELKKKYKEHYVTSVVQVGIVVVVVFNQNIAQSQCGGNRRADMQKFKKVTIFHILKIF